MKMEVLMVVIMTRIAVVVSSIQRPALYNGLADGKVNGAYCCLKRKDTLDQRLKITVETIQ